LPDPFVFAILLTVVTACGAVVWVGAGPLDVLSAWYEGFWMLLEFGMQMVLILATGYAIALSPWISTLIDRLAATIERPATVYLTVLAAGVVLDLVSWGWVVLAAVLGRELALRVRGVHYPFLIACVFFSSGSWVAGLSSSIPLLLNTPGNFLIEAGLLEDVIPTSLTLASPLNLCVVVLYLVGGTALMYLLRPRDRIVELRDLLSGDARSGEPTVADEARDLQASPPTPSDRLNTSAVLHMMVVSMGAAAVVLHFVRNGFDLNLNIMIFLFLLLGMLLHGSPIRYVVAMRRACSNISGIVFQYPFYAGIMGIMLTTGLGTAVAAWIASAVSLDGLPLAAFVLGGFVNFSIPSAGGEWAVIGPPLVEAVHELGGAAPGPELNRQVARVAMAVAYGESLTNLLQPFFLLIVLPVMGAGVRIQARDIVGYFFVPFLVMFTAVGLLVAVSPW
jgi:short-chain fatty acids transporter